MRKKEAIFVKSLLNRVEERDELLEHLSPKDREALKEYPSFPLLNYATLFSLSNFLKKIHFSWFKDPLEKSPSPKIPPFFLLFPESEGEKLSMLLNIPYQKVATSPIAKTYVMNELKKLIEDSSVLPEEFLPPSPANDLLKLSRRELLHLIDLLGIYDLAGEIRQIVDKNLLGKIAAALTNEQRNFLQYASKQPMKYLPPGIGLAKWDGDPKKLDRLLHKRGLVRLSYAISEEAKSFRWHLLHRLDIGRAKVMEKLLATRLEPDMIAFFKKQVNHLSKKFVKEVVTSETV